jgi:hypothetical protein
MDTWAIVELMGHVTLAGRITKPGENGGLWQIDTPDGESFATQFFGSQSVYRIRMVNEQIARVYAESASNKIIEYDAPIISRQEHQEALNLAQENYYALRRENENLKHKIEKLISIEDPPALPDPQNTHVKLIRDFRDDELDGLLDPDN